MVTPSPRPLPRAVDLTELVGNGPAGVSITGISMDSRLVQPGDVYLAVPGSNAHGAAFAADVLRCGAVAIITDAAGKAMIDAAQLPGQPVVVTVDNPRASAGALAHEVYHRPSEAMIVVGLTGTNGKTTMSFLLESAFRAAGMVTGVLGTTGHRVADRVLPTERTTPEAVEVHGLLGHMRDEGVDAVVMEVSSHAMAFGRVGSVDFDAAVFTNLTQDHLDFHGTMDSYFEAKAGLFEQARRRIICLDDQWGRTLAGRFPDAVGYAVDSPAPWRATDLRPAGTGSTFTVIDPAGGRWPAAVALPGRFNVANALGAITCAVALGLDVPTVIDGVAACAGVPGRMQPVPNDRGIRAYVDYAHTPDAVERAIRAAPGRVIAVLGCGGDRDPTKRPLMGEAAARLADLVVITDDNPRSEEPAAIRAAMTEGAMSVPASERAEIIEIGDRRQAIAAAVGRAGHGDSVLVLGKGHEQGQTVGDTYTPFDDVVELAAALEESGS